MGTDTIFPLHMSPRWISSRGKKWLSGAVFLFALSALAQAPETSLTGEIFDEMGGPVVAAKASLMAEDGHLYLARTTEKGIFRFPRIQPGNFTLDLDQSGLCVVHMDQIRVAAGEQKKLPRITMASPNTSGSCP